jgi:hypothetical protein
MTEQHLDLLGRGIAALANPGGAHQGGPCLKGVYGIDR